LKFIHQKAFSVIELLVVIAVVSIVAAIGLPAISNFGVAENNENDKAIIRSQINYVRQLAIENGNAYRIKIINNAINNSSQLEVYRDESLNRFNKQFHKTSVPPCSQFSEINNEGFLISDLTKQAEHYVITKCDSLTGACNAVTNSNNYFCILPDGSGADNTRAQIQSSKNAGSKILFLHFYETGFFNLGQRIQ
jgi:prepilin-type N-terminal cleavage/methylation domain-containing protein